MRDKIRMVSEKFKYVKLVYIDNRNELEYLQNQIDLTKLQFINVVIVFGDELDECSGKVIENIKCKKIFCINKKNNIYISRKIFSDKEISNLSPIKVNIFSNIDVECIIENMLILLINSSINNTEIYSIVSYKESIVVFKMQ